MQVVDPKGKWYKNTGAYTFVDPESGTRFESGEVVKATATAWIKGQPVLQEVADPTAEVSKPADKLKK